jgi:hypothetical protein
MYFLDFNSLHKYYELALFIYKHVENFIWLVKLAIQYDVGVITDFVKKHADDFYWLFKSTCKIVLVVLTTILELVTCGCKFFFLNCNVWFPKFHGFLSCKMFSIVSLAKTLSAKTENNYQLRPHPQSVDIITYPGQTRAPDCSSSRCNQMQSSKPLCNKISRGKYITISKNNQNILNDWLQEHANYPYPSECDCKEMELKTGLSEKRIRDWLNWQRTKNKKLQVSYFSIEDKIKMVQFYNHVSKQPGPQDFEALAKELQKDWKHIRTFFNNERFAEKKYLLNKRKN